MSAETLPVPPAPALTVLSGGPTRSLLYAEDGWDWKDASALEIGTERTYLTQRLALGEDPVIREELARVERAAALTTQRTAS